MYMTTELLGATLAILGQGMVGVLAVMAVIALVVGALNKLGSKGNDKK